MTSCYCAEVEALSAIFCGKGEFELKSLSGKESLFVITPPQTGELGLSLTCTLNGDTIVQTSVQVNLSDRIDLEILKTFSITNLIFKITY